MEMAVVQLGGHPVYTRGEEVGFDIREPVEDIARVMAGYHGLLAARVFDHVTVNRMAAVVDVPVVNMLSRPLPPAPGARRRAHDAAVSRPAGRQDGGVRRRLQQRRRAPSRSRSMLGMHIRFACPARLRRPARGARALGLLGAASSSSPPARPKPWPEPHAVHTDTWTSMGQEDEKQQRIQQFEGYTVDADTMALAAPAAVFMHCLPAYRGLEVAADVIDGPQSVVFRQGHNRLHAARGAMAFLLGVRPHPTPPDTTSPDTTSEGGLVSKVQRQTTISRLIGDHEVTSQPQLVELLAEHGIEATQATVSRDLDDIGAIKVRVPSGNTVYAIPEFAPDRLAPRRPAAPGDGGVGGRGRPVGQPRRAAHAPGLCACRRVCPRSQPGRRAPRHRRRRRHPDVCLGIHRRPVTRRSPPRPCGLE